MIELNYHSFILTKKQETVALWFEYGVPTSRPCGPHGTLVRENINSSQWGKDKYFLILFGLRPELHI